MRRATGRDKQDFRLGQILSTQMSRKFKSDQSSEAVTQKRKRIIQK